MEQNTKKVNFLLLPICKIWQIIWFFCFLLSQNFDLCKKCIRTFHVHFSAFTACTLETKLPIKRPRSAPRSRYFLLSLFAVRAKSERNIFAKNHAKRSPILFYSHSPTMKSIRRYYNSQTTYTTTPLTKTQTLINLLNIRLSIILSAEKNKSINIFFLVDYQRACLSVVCRLNLMISQSTLSQLDTTSINRKMQQARRGKCRTVIWSSFVRRNSASNIRK